MSGNDEIYLDTFGTWLARLGDDARTLGEVVSSELPETTRRYAAAGVNYIFKSLDLIPDGIDDLGYLDDAFVLRVAASLAYAESEGAESAVLGRLAGESSMVREFLGDGYAPLENYVRGLTKGAARARTVDDILGDAEIRGRFLHELIAWTQEYKNPPFSRDPKTLIKLRAFLRAKLG